jgi:hypothetical protein
MKVILMMLLVAAAIAVLAHAPGNAQPQSFATACAEDIKLHCAGVRAGEGRIRACIREHLKDLSKPCREVFTRARTVARACAADVKTHCADVQRGGGRIGKCLREHLDSLSPPCKDALTYGSGDNE